ncbi:TetR/AcrR family transcriptional regulator [Mucilaginibacter sp.]|uniref:TetR/AcrR family transcriptional regulator n=1 Tax=Mucilaginibacter sp. TaxID=1882438 RepID=UPI00261D44CA|nr:TetR/AcrR family transcriptional regulator [Mucilaginibacter sp.]MDB5126281.1 transcriptional regulator, TetR family [Mucilaginibacter sp.]
MARKKEFDEDELLEKAVNLFWEKGYYATSAQDLVDGLGINRSSLYNTYTDKRTLFTKSLKHYQDKQTSAVLSLLNNADNIYEVVKEIFDRIIQESIKDDLTKGCFMVNTAVELSSHDPEIKNLVNLNNQSVVDALTRAIEKGQKSGQINQDSTPLAIARFIFNTISGLRVTARSGADEKTLQDIASVTLQSLK